MEVEMNQAKARCSFTLIELLVVIVIIAVLIGMLLPAIMRLRDRTRDIDCKNNLKNLHQAAMNHLYEFEALPSSRSYEHDEASTTPPWFGIEGWCAWRNWSSHAYPARPGRPDVWWGSLGRACITNVLPTGLVNYGPSSGYYLGSTLWEFVGKNYKAYMCPKFYLRVVGQKAPDGSTITETDGLNPPWRAYVMNSLAGEQRDYDYSGMPLGSLQGASRRLLFSDAHDSYTNQAMNRAGTGLVRICTRGVRDPDPNYGSGGAATLTTAYVPDNSAIYDDSWGARDYRVRLCTFDCELYGGRNDPASPAGNRYPFESVGVHHGVTTVNGVNHPFGFGVFVDGHVESLCWWQTTNACTGNW